MDALVVGAEMIDALQVIVSRDVSPFEPAVLTIGEFHAGVAKNVMAGTAYLSGTVRTFSPELRVQLRERMERMVRMVAEAFGAEATFT